MKLRRTLTTLLAGLIALAGAIAGCGGGVGTGGTGSFGATTYTYGEITGFGSIIVNGVRFDDDDAQVVDDLGGSRSRDELRLGMTVGIDSSDVTTAGTGREARAAVVRLGTVLEAPIASIDTAGNRFVALGQTVRVQASTVFDDSLPGDLAALSPGTMVEVHGFLDAATSSIVATRIEGSSRIDRFKARGRVAALDAAARRLRIGDADFDYGAAVDTPAALAVGQPVTVYVQPVPDPQGRWVVTGFGVRSPSRPSDDLLHADLRGVVTAFTDARRFAVNDTTVDATAAQFPDGTSFGMGSRVKVEGRLSAGVLVAGKVELESDDDIRDEGIDLRGAIESLDAAATTLRLRGSTVFYGGNNVRFEGGTAARLDVGVRVRVKGRLADDRRRVNAEEIRFE
jgi:hypothetical protein